MYEEYQDAMYTQVEEHSVVERLCLTYSNHQRKGTATPYIKFDPKICFPLA